MNPLRMRRAVVGVCVLLVLLGAFGLYVFGAVSFVPRSVADVKYSVIDAVGTPLVCTGWGQPNPPFQPAQTYPRIVADVPTYVAILRRVHVPDVVTVYREWLKLDAVRLDRQGGIYHFEMLLGGGDHPEAEQNPVVGSVDLYGRVSNVHYATTTGACLL
jgi:hypothetical protein